MDKLELSEINYLAVFAAGLLYFFLGALWYQVLFINIWLKEINKSLWEIDWIINARNLGISFLISLLICGGIAVLVNITDPESIAEGLLLGLLLGFLFVFFPNALNTMHEGSSLVLLLINTGFHCTGILISTVLLSLWR